MLNRLYMPIREALRRRPIASVVCLAAALALVGIQVWDRCGPLPAFDWNARNLQRIQLTDTNNYCFAVFGDNKNSHVPFERLLDAVDGDQEIAFALDLGDTVYDGEREKFRYFLGQVRRHLHKPLLTAMGNHETEDQGRGLYAEIFGPFYYTFRLGQTAFIVLDDANEQRVDLWQRSWLEQTLRQARSDNCLILVFAHVPLHDPRGGIYNHCLADQESADDLQQLFNRYGVAHLFCSHIHGFFQGAWGDLPYTITGGAGAELAGGMDPDHYFHHYLKVSITNGDLNIDVQRMPSQEYEWLDRLGSVVWLYGYAFVAIHGLEAVLALVIAFLLTVIFRRRSLA